MDKYIKREYLPGYTGYIPQKINTYGISTGEINRRLVTKEKDGAIPSDVPRNIYQTAPHMEMDTETDNLKYGPRSKQGITWIGGGTEKVYPQHIPGNPFLCDT